MKNNYLRRIRELHNFSQEYVAEQLGISQSNYSRIENGSIMLDMDRLLTIASLYHVEPIMFLDCKDKIESICQNGRKCPLKLLDDSDESSSNSHLKRIERIEKKLIELNATLSFLFEQRLILTKK